MSKHKAYSDECGGEIVVHLDTPTTSDDRKCHGKEAVRIKVTRGRKTLWAPRDPLCLSPMINLDTRKGKLRAVEDVVGFFEHYRCGRGRSSDE